MDEFEFVEVDPTGRYGRYNDILGKGASKIVYRAFDEYEGIEVAWNQVKLYDFLQSPEDLERLYCEIHLLKTLKHKNIMKFYTSWVDTANRNINFVTEMFTSGTLRQYRLKHKKVNIRAVKRWCRQILRGLLYLHSHDPPVIHRDLKCDNIFVNGNQGEVKIGDLGLAAILKKSHAAHCVGTPEFMAPEVYEEAYNELVDIYSFGMCVLEMVTFEYPYSECSHPAQIYKKVISGKKPDALYKVKDPEVRRFVDKCLATVSRRLSARELLNDPFLQIEESDLDSRPLDCSRDFDDLGPFLRQPLLELNRSCSSMSNGYLNSLGFNDQSDWGYNPVELESSGIELFEHHEDEHCEETGISIRGKMREDGGIFLRLRISDKEGRIRNIYFPFDTENDTAISVAAEMVAELDITDQDVTRIADMIDGEIASLVPGWQTGPGLVETPRFANSCHNCASSNHTSSGGSFMEDLPGVQCGCASTHGRFEEITYQPEPDGEEEEEEELSPVGSGQSHSDEEYGKSGGENCHGTFTRELSGSDPFYCSTRTTTSDDHDHDHDHDQDDDDDDDDENDYEVLEKETTMQGLRRVKAKHHRSGIVSNCSDGGNATGQRLGDLFLSSLVLNTISEDGHGLVGFQSSAYNRDRDRRNDRDRCDFLGNARMRGPSSGSQRAARSCESKKNAKSFSRVVSLQVDGIDI